MEKGWRGTEMGWRGTEDKDNPRVFEERRAA